MAGKKDFTLIELMVVMAVIFVVIGITVPAMLPMVKGAALKGKARNIKAMFMHARDQALTKQKFVVITFTFDGPGDMNGDGDPGVADEDDDQDGFTDEDVRDPNVYSVDKNAYDYWFANNYYLYERGYVQAADAAKIYSYEQPDPPHKGKNPLTTYYRKIYETKDSSAITYNDFDSPANDDEDLLVDEGDEIYLESVGVLASINGMWHNERSKKAGAAVFSHYEHVIPLYQQSRARNQVLSDMVLSEKLFLGEHVHITRIWAATNTYPAIDSNSLVLCRKSIHTVSPDPGNPNNGPFNVPVGDDIIDPHKHPPEKRGEYVFSGIAYGPDGQLYYRADSTNNDPAALEGIVIEITDTSGVDRRFIKAMPVGAIKITR